MDLKDLESSENFIRALGDFSNEVMQLMHKQRKLSRGDTTELRETLEVVHELMARIGYVAS